MSQDNVVSEIKLIPSLLIAAASVLFGAAISHYVYDELGRASFLCALVVMLSIYSCRHHLSNIYIVIYITAYAVGHIFLSAAYGSYLEHIPGVMIIMLAVVDYAWFYFGAQLVSKNR